jgi:hypothetical protein
VPYPPQAGGKDKLPNDANNDNDPPLPEVGRGPEFNSFEDTRPPTQGNNRAPYQHEINADLDLANILLGRCTRAYFTSITFDCCFALALIKPTVGLKLLSLPLEPRN